MLCPLRGCIKAFFPEYFGRTPCSGVVATGSLGILPRALTPASLGLGQNDKFWNGLVFPIVSRKSLASCRPNPVSAPSRLLLDFELDYGAKKW